MNFPVLDGTYAEKMLTPSLCVSLMRETLQQEEAGACIQYLRTAISLPNTNVLGLMPGWFDGYFGVKTISVYHTNAGSAYPSHQGQILLFGADHGEILVSVDAASITKIRTGAVSAVASMALARPGSGKLAILGCGAQGESHMRAILDCFALTDIYLWDIYPAAAQRLCEKVPEEVRGHRCDTVQEAVEDADIICTVTPSATPILKLDWVKRGVHINAVGACAPQQRELDSDLVEQAAFYCDNVESVLHESGDFLFPLKEGRVSEAHIRGTVGQVLNHKIAGRGSDSEITVFEALGMAVEDIAAAKFLYDRWKEEQEK